MNDTTTERQRGERAAGFISPAGGTRWAGPPAARPERSGRCRWGGLIFLAVLAGLLTFCHGCHGDIDEELLSLGWWVAAGR